MEKDILQEILKSLPEQPGIYQFFDKKDKILYVGKAKNLKNRVNSYFQKQIYENGKTQLLVKSVYNLKFIIVNNEFEALLLENSLIKLHQPRFNVLLKDDKTYPWICIKKEPFPRIFPTRKKINDGSEYFGPYASVKMMKIVLELIKQLYSIRTCNLLLSSENLQKKKFKVCLEYHIGNCKGPCELKQTENEYQIQITEIKNIFKGNINDVVKMLKEQMFELANKYFFEEAEEIRKKIEELEKFKQKSVVVSTDISNVDVFTYQDEPESFYINYLKIQSGSITHSHTIELRKKLNESVPELLEIGIFELRNLYHSNATEIIVSVLPENQLPGVRYVQPQRGDKKMLLDLSKRNLFHFVQEKFKQVAIKDPERHSKRILEQMKNDLRMQELPIHIECFDNSNFQGSFPVSAMVCFKNAKPSKKDYRHFNVKTVVGPNDFDTMKEVIFRRYSRLLEDNADLPQLIVIDGGKGQLSAALESLEKLGLRGKITIIGIAKRLEEIYYPGDPLPLHLDKKSETLKVIQHMRNEAHRFGITHYRNRHNKQLIRSELDDIHGIGEQTKTILLNTFKSVEKIKHTDLKELAATVGMSKAIKIKEYFSKQIN